ncbi:malonyl-ACP O-methyltransferase BioC [Clostridium cylindrosporum]|uniref:Malonyl-[acyl-carrier protein] O-methyltransferase n=1 Tax=Clostridium cylindrosporum DSM 605 TaxID=1121307 RepID=A0A0J8FZ58_CLOCY|nr:malonyl-ACP O-methyltransferase BioC [Clostridium cylindrosporum]KMT20906.1 malonyl-[acyl-carrier protein] O-methyltransferase BioC [Clostridium cylindrosporum DSM 605]
MINKERVKCRFNKSSVDYNKYAKVQVTMASRLMNMINKSDIKTILEIGCGTGNLTNMLLDKFRNVSLTVMDLSEKMLDETRKNISVRNLENIEFICHDGETCELNKKYDLIISNATFQWFNSLEESIKKYIDLLNENGQLLISTFGEDTFIELEKSGIKAARELNVEHNFKLRRSFVGIDEIENIIKNQNINYKVVDEKLKEYHKSSRDFIKSVKKIGANTCGSEGGITPPRVIKKVLEVYDRDFVENKFVYSTYHCIYISINK